MQVIKFGSNGRVAPIHGLTTGYDASPLRGRLIGVSRWADTARMLVAVHAMHDNPVIMEGEPGTGKKLLAKLIHRSSSRREGPFVVLSLNSTTDQLARDILFGSPNPRSIPELLGEKGLAELVRGGTLLVDCQTEVSSSLVEGLMRIAHQPYDDEERPVRVPLGLSNQTERLRSGTEGVSGFTKFDYERIQIPALRERADDIVPLTEYFLRELCQRFGKETRRISPEAMDALQAYDWPRNVRELKTLLIQLVKQSPSIDSSILPAYIKAAAEKVYIPAAGLDLEEEVRRVEMDLIAAALRQSRGYQNKAAQLLRLKPTTLFMKIRRYGIDVEAFKRAS